MLKLWKFLFWGSFIGLVFSIIDILKGIFNSSYLLYDLFPLVIFLLLFLLGVKKYYITYYRKCNRLRKQKWFKELLNRYTFLFLFNSSIQEYIEKSDIKDILNDQEKTAKFKDNLRGIIIKENL